jgi:hypothetical protein
MLAANPKLRDEFARRVESNPQFASNPRERLQFFYERSTYWDPYINLYPVGRIVKPLAAKTRPASEPRLLE